MFVKCGLTIQRNFDFAAEALHVDCYIVKSDTVAECMLRYPGQNKSVTSPSRCYQFNYKCDVFMEESKSYFNICRMFISTLVILDM